MTRYLFEVSIGLRFRKQRLSYGAYLLRVLNMASLLRRGLFRFVRKDGRRPGERENVPRAPFHYSKISHREPLRRREKHGGNTGMSRCKRNRMTSRMCPEHSNLHFWLGNGYVKIILRWGKIYFCQRVIISKSGSTVYIRRLCRVCWPLVPQLLS